MLMMGIDAGSRCSKCVILDDGKLMTYGSIETDPDIVKTAQAVVDAAVQRQTGLWGEYGRMGDPGAHFGLLAVRHFGGRKGKVFHGGIDEWQAAGQSVATERTQYPAVEQQLTDDPTVQIYLIEALAKLSTDVQFIDTRALKAFRG